MSSQVTLLLTALSFLAAFVLITIWHEFGHLVAAWYYRVPVRLIGVGVGPCLWHFRLSDAVALDVRAFPLGMAIGVLGRRSNDGQARRPASHDLVVAMCGPAASLVLGLLLLPLMRLTHSEPGLQTLVADDSAYVGVANGFEPASPAGARRWTYSSARRGVPRLAIFAKAGGRPAPYGDTCLDFGVPAHYYRYARHSLAE